MKHNRIEIHRKTIFNFFKLILFILMLFSVLFGTFIIYNKDEWWMIFYAVIITSILAYDIIERMNKLFSISPEIIIYRDKIEFYNGNSFDQIDFENIKHVRTYLNVLHG